MRTATGDPVRGACALAKLYINELGSVETLACVAAADVVATSQLSRVEVEATLARAVRMRRLSSSEATSAVARFARDWSAYVAVPLNEVLVTAAARATWRHDLRTNDAIHLVSALELEVILGAPVTMGTFDDALWNAAVREGLAAWPQTLAPFRT